MLIHRLLPLSVVCVGFLLASHNLLPRRGWAQQNAAQQTASPTPTMASFQASLAQAKQTGRPLIVFGLSDTCPRCQAVKRGVASDPEFRLLLTQYVSAEVPFGGRVFATIFRDISRQDSNTPSAIGAPSVFIFTSQGKAVYAGPDRQSGIALDDEFKKLLILGIEQNGGLHSPEATNPRSLTTDLAEARRLINKDQPAAAAAVLAKHLTAPETNDDEQVDELIQLTGLEIATSKGQDELDALAQQLIEQARPAIQAAVALGETEKATLGAVQLAELQRGFGDFSPLAPTLEAAWQALEETAQIPELRQQARMIDEARQAEAARDSSTAVAAYEKVIHTFPDTSAAKLSRIRAAQLQPPKPEDMRVWTSKDGRFSVNAALLSFEDDAVQLRSSKGKAISVPASALSAEDRRFLQSQSTDE